MGKADWCEAYEKMVTDRYYRRMEHETNKKIFGIFLDVLEKSKKCGNLGQITPVIMDAVKKLRENGIIKNIEDEEEYKKAILSYFVNREGKEKSRFSVIDHSGVEFCCGNVDYDGKIFFIVSANGKTVECMEIDTNQ